MPRKERDYKAEYAREKEKGWKKNTSFTVNLTPEKKQHLMQRLHLNPKKMVKQCPEMDCSTNGLICILRVLWNRRHDERIENFSQPVF